MSGINIHYKDIQKYSKFELKEYRPQLPAAIGRQNQNESGKEQKPFVSKKLAPLNHEPLYPYLGMLTQLIKTNSTPSANTLNSSMSHKPFIKIPVLTPTSTNSQPALLPENSITEEMLRPSYSTVKAAKKLNYIDMLSTIYQNKHPAGNSHLRKTSQPNMNTSDDKLPKIKTTSIPETFVVNNGLIIRKMQFVENKASQKPKKAKKQINLTGSNLDVYKAKKDFSLYMAVLNSNKYKVFFRLSIISKSLLCIKEITVA